MAEIDGLLIIFVESRVSDVINDDALNDARILTKRSPNWISVFCCLFESFYSCRID